MHRSTRLAKQQLKPSDTDLGVYCDSVIENELAFIGRVMTYRAELE